ncbi:MAG: septal ring lytic transglycosylase RlpA family protein [Thermoanaerobaculia bacterium]|nr:septal ring lytic transglycosylase RlpA family protein [Thermoanaerobaculia bacterium]
MTSEQLKTTTRLLAVALFVFASYGCATTAPAPQASQILQGIASWYGEEFSGRTTANGEIFDPLQLTAAHRTLPFGTVLEVTNPKSSKMVRVRINDRGPYVGNRVLDLSYAAAQQIGLIEPGSGMVEMKIINIGKGEREPPAPFEVTIDELRKPIVVAVQDPPPVAFPLPSETGANDFRVDVVEERRGVPTRRQVGADGKTIENVPMTSAPTQVPPPAPAAITPPKRVATSTKFVVQLGAFSQETNAKALLERVTRIGQSAFVDHATLYRVRMGPFDTRDQAVAARTVLEANGMSAIVLAE